MNICMSLYRCDDEKGYLEVPCEDEGTQKYIMVNSEGVLDLYLCIACDTAVKMSTAQDPWPVKGSNSEAYIALYRDLIQPNAT